MEKADLLFFFFEYFNSEKAGKVPVCPEAYLFIY